MGTKRDWHCRMAAVFAAWTLACAQARMPHSAAASPAGAPSAPALQPALDATIATSAPLPNVSNTPPSAPDSSAAAPNDANVVQPAAAGEPARASDAGPAEAGTAQPAGRDITQFSMDCARRPLSRELSVKPTTVCEARNPERCMTELACKSAADCRKRPGGFCSGYERDGYVEFTRCLYDSCQSDADCKPGEACACDGTNVRVCVKAACHADADCDATQRCVRADTCGFGPFGSFMCTSAADQCRTNQDCLDKGAGNSCTNWEHDYLECVSIICD